MGGKKQVRLGTKYAISQQVFWQNIAPGKFLNQRYVQVERDQNRVQATKPLMLSLFFLKDL